jgi:hypothetical protein
MTPATRPGQPHLTQTTFTTLAAGAALPGHIVVQDKRSVVITSNALADFLKALYEAGMRNVVVVVEAAGERLAIEASIYRKHDKRGGRVHHLLYPGGAKSEGTNKGDKTDATEGGG